MISNFPEALRRVLAHEGSFSNHPLDKGGPTNKGVTLDTYRAHINPRGTIADLKAITAAQIETVYRNQYWNKVGGDLLPAGVDYAVFDFAVNSGVSRAARYLQAIVGVSQDGQIGPKTIEAVKGKAADFIINQLCDRRLAFLKNLSTWSTFGKGWSSRVSGVRSAAIEMAKKNVPPARSDNAKPGPSVPVQEAEISDGDGWLIALLKLTAQLFQGRK